MISNQAIDFLNIQVSISPDIFSSLIYMIYLDLDDDSDMQVIFFGHMSLKGVE